MKYFWMPFIPVVINIVAAITIGRPIGIVLFGSIFIYVIIYVVYRALKEGFIHTKQNGFIRRSEKPLSYWVNITVQFLALLMCLAIIYLS